LILAITALTGSQIFFWGQYLVDSLRHYC